MNRVRVFLAVFVNCILLVTMASSETSAASGIEGVVSVSPSRPGPIRVGEESTSRPAANIEFSVKAGETKVASFTTDADGRFRVALPPGHYVVLREDAGSKIGRWRFEADVVAGEVAKVSWTGDSGMR